MELQPFLFETKVADGAVHKSTNGIRASTPSRSRKIQPPEHNGALQQAQREAFQGAMK